MEPNARDLADLYEQTIKHLKTKLDSAAWKLDEFEKSVVNVMKNVPSTVSVSVMELMQEVNNMRDDFEALHTEISSTVKLLDDTKAVITEELNNISAEMGTLKCLFKTLNLQQ